MQNEIKVINLAGEILKKQAFDKELLVDKINKQAIFDTIVAEQASIYA